MNGFMKKLGAAAALSVAGLSISFPASALVFGYYLDNASGSPAASIAAAGHTAQQLTNLTASDLTGIDVLWILNGNNSTPDANVTGNTAAINTFVQNGGVLSFHDRNVTDAQAYIPGTAGVTFVRDFNDDANIQVLVSNTVTNGITNTTLDGGTSSSHGYVLSATAPAGAVGVLSQGDSSHWVDFYYSLGQGDVYYSTIPLDYYFGGGNGPAEFTTVYAVNEAAFQAELRRGNNTNVVPEPASIALLGLGLFGLAVRRRKVAA